MEVVLHVTSTLRIENYAQIAKVKCDLQKSSLLYSNSVFVVFISSFQFVG